MAHNRASHHISIRVLGAAVIAAVLAVALMTLPASGATAEIPARASIHVKIVAANHAPVMNKNWSYAVKVTDSHGQPLSGTETTQYTFSGSVVGTEKPENVKFKDGVYKDTIQFPPAAVGHPLAVRATVHTKDGSGSASWAITVKQ